MRRIEYTYNEKVGPNQIAFLRDMPAHITRGGRHRIRQALFLCPYCNTPFVCRIESIKKGSTKSCGCHSGKFTAERNTIDITGQKFGKLTAIHSTGVIGSKNGCYLWEFRCDCGQSVVLPCGWVTSGNTTSCGCNKSKGETKVANILDDLSLEYVRQYSFDDCKNIENTRRFYFDFYIPQYNILLEYDGEQHFSANGRTWNTQDNLIKTQKRDKNQKRLLLTKANSSYSYSLF